MSSGSLGVHTGPAISEQKAACEAYVQTHQLDILLRDVLNELCFLHSKGKLDSISPYLKFAELITDGIYRDELERLDKVYSALRQRKQRKDGSGFNRDIAVPAILSAEVNPDKKTPAQTDANMFLTQHGLKEFLPNMLNDLILQRRENPKLYMIEACLDYGGIDIIDQFDPILKRYLDNPKILTERPAMLVKDTRNGEVDPKDEEDDDGGAAKQTSDSYDTNTGLDTETEFGKGIPGFQPHKKYHGQKSASEDHI